MVGFLWFTGCATAGMKALEAAFSERIVREDDRSVQRRERLDRLTHGDK